LYKRITARWDVRVFAPDGTNARDPLALCYFLGDQRDISQMIG
jgi:hypothetical protein